MTGNVVAIIMVYFMKFELGNRLVLLPFILYQIYLHLPVVHSALDKASTVAGLPESLVLTKLASPVPTPFAFFVSVAIVSYGFVLVHKNRFDGKKQFIPYAGR